MPLASVAPADGTPQRDGPRARPGLNLEAGSGFQKNSNPGIRRPRWGGVVEGVAGQIRHPLAYVIGGKAQSGVRFGRRLEGAARPGIDESLNSLDLV